MEGAKRKAWVNGINGLLTAFIGLLAIRAAFPMPGMKQVFEVVGTQIIVILHKFDILGTWDSFRMARDHAAAIGIGVACILFLLGWYISKKIGHHRGACKEATKTKTEYYQCLINAANQLKRELESEVGKCNSIKDPTTKEYCYKKINKKINYIDKKLSEYNRKIGR